METSHIEMNAAPEAALLLFELLREGFVVHVPSGVSVADLLVKELGLSADYVNTRLRTVFLDGQPVDDIESAMVPDGSTLALGMAMPGLVGAVLRSGSPICAFRRDIAHTSGKSAPGKKEGVVTIKLFSHIPAEIGPKLLERGIWVKAARLARSLSQPGFGDKVGKASIDGRELPFSEISSNLKEMQNDIHLRLEASKGAAG